MIAASVDVARTGVELTPNKPTALRMMRSSPSSSTAGHHPRQREVAAASRDLAETEADPALPHREPRRDEHLVVGQRGRPTYR